MFRPPLNRLFLMGSWTSLLFSPSKSADSESLVPTDAFQKFSSSFQSLHNPIYAARPSHSPPIPSSRNSREMCQNASHKLFMATSRASWHGSIEIWQAISAAVWGGWVSGLNPNCFVGCSYMNSVTRLKLSDLQLSSLCLIGSGCGWSDDDRKKRKVVTTSGVFDDNRLPMRRNWSDPQLRTRVRSSTGHKGSGHIRDVLFNALYNSSALEDI